jgi:CrcB protein
LGAYGLAAASFEGLQRHRLCNLNKRREALQKYLLIAAGGALGSIARYWVGSTISGRMGIRFPYGTLVVNITACVIIGFSLTYLGKRVDLNPAWRYLIPIGFIGAYSTFSTYEWETLSTMRSGAFLLAALYAAGSLVLGLAAVWGGSVLAEALS